MSRSNFRDAILVADEEGTAKVLSGIEIRVYQAGTETEAPVYGSRPLTDAAPLTQPLETDENGIVDFWAPAGDYDIAYHDTIGDPRILDQSMGWSPLSGADGGVSGTKIATDATLPLGSFSSVVMRQFVPLGTVIEWWRPSSSWDAGAGAGNPPPGFAVCNGQTLTSGNHDFGPVSITLPDLRNKYIIGADILKTDSAASSAGDGTAAYNSQHPNAPGIRGVGGSNASHVHAVPAHKHGKGSLAITASGGHTHTGTTGNESQNHTHASSIENPVWLVGGGGSGAVVWGDFTTDTGLEDFRKCTPSTGGATSNHTHSFTTAPNTHAHANGDFSGVVGATGGVDGDSSFDTNSVDARPAHYGLLRIMKVRRN